MTACGLDFGTSNSALGVLRDGAPVLAPVEGQETLIPSAIFYDLEQWGRVIFGQEAISASIAPHDGRLMRALKTILGSPLIDEEITAASGILLSIAGGDDLTLIEVNEAAEVVTSAADQNANIIFGAVIDDAVGDDVRVTVIATGFGAQRRRRRREARSEAPGPSPPGRGVPAPAE